MVSRPPSHASLANNANNAEHIWVSIFALIARESVPALDKHAALFKVNGSIHLSGLADTFSRCNKM
jgi:hypothetical protein